MTREPYILKAKEIQSLVAGLAAHGPQLTYEQMRKRATQAMENANDVDEMFLDMHEYMLKKARELEVEDDDDLKLQIFYYTIASMLRKLAHEIYRAYLKLGKERASNRFIRLVSDNPNSPALEW